MLALLILNSCGGPSPSRHPATPRLQLTSAALRQRVASLRAARRRQAPALDIPARGLYFRCGLEGFLDGFVT